MVRRIRLHGRGGEGVKLASRIVTRAAFLRGMTVQDSPLFGAERRGAPVVAFARIADGPILERGYIERPDAVGVMDASLLDHPEAGILAGIDASALFVVNTAMPADELVRRHRLPGVVIALDISGLALEVIGRHVLSAPMAGAIVRAASLAGWDTLAAAVQTELASVGVAEAALERNLAATRRAFLATPRAGLAPFPLPAERQPAAAVPPLFEIPHLPARLAAPTIPAPPTSALRSVDGWRIWRPVIERARCTRCVFCFALCPEGAIGLDAEGYPHIDYAHCKGCLVCASECPPGAITSVREEVARCASC